MPEIGKRMFYVVMSKTRPGCGKASCIDDTESKPSKGKIVREFYREYAGREIRYVDANEMHRLMTNEPVDQ